MNKTIHTIVIGSLATPPYNSMFEQSRRVYSQKGIAPTMHTCGGGNLEPKIMIEYE